MQPQSLSASDPQPPTTELKAKGLSNEKRLHSQRHMLFVSIQYLMRGLDQQFNGQDRKRWNASRHDRSMPSQAVGCRVFEGTDFANCSAEDRNATRVGVVARQPWSMGRSLNTCRDFSARAWWVIFLRHFRHWCEPVPCRVGHKVVELLTSMRPLYQGPWPMSGFPGIGCNTGCGEPALPSRTPKASNSHLKLIPPVLIRFRSPAPKPLDTPPTALEAH